MAVDIKLPERSATGSTRGSRAKPSFEQITGGGFQTVGDVAIKFFGPLFSNLVKSRSVNEVAQFKSNVNTTLKEWDSYIETHPGEDFGELEKKRNQMMTAIKGASAGATTKSARDAIDLWYTEEEELLAAKSQATLERIGTKQERVSYELQRKGFVNSFDREGLTKLTGKMVDAGLLNKEVAAFQMKNDLAIIDKAEKKVQLEQLTRGVEQQAFAIAAEQGYPAAEAWLRKPETTESLIDSGVDRKDIRSLLNDIEERTATEINKLREVEQKATVELNTETRKTASELLRDNKLTVEWVTENRDNMTGSDFERYNFALRSIAEAEKTFQRHLAEIEDPFNREILGKLEAATTPEQLDALQTTVDDYVSKEVKNLNVKEAQQWTNEIDKKRDELVLTRAEGFPAWSALMDDVNRVRAGELTVDLLRLKVDQAVTPMPGETALITEGQGASIIRLLNGIEQDPELKTSPALTRAHAAFGRLRTLQIGLIEERRQVQVRAGQEGLELPVTKKGEFQLRQRQTTAVEISITRMQNKLEAYAETVAKEKNAADLISTKYQELTRPVIEEVTLDLIQRAGGKFGFLPGIRTQPEILVEGKVKSLEEQPEFETMTDEEKEQARKAFDKGFTVDDVIDLVTRGKSIQEAVGKTLAVRGGEGSTLTEDEQKRREELRRKAGLQ